MMLPVAPEGRRCSSAARAHSGGVGSSEGGEWRVGRGESCAEAASAGRRPDTDEGAESPRQREAQRRV